MGFLTSLQNTFLGALVILAISWLLNEWSKRRHENYIRKEQKYTALLKSLKGFYVHSQSRELREEFIDQINQCWLYCPDEVIQKAYAFLEKVHTDVKFSDLEKEKSLGELVLAIRKDLYTQYPFKNFFKDLFKKTKLKPEDFKHLRST